MFCGSRRRNLNKFQIPTKSPYFLQNSPTNKEYTLVTPTGKPNKEKGGGKDDPVDEKNNETDGTCNGNSIYSFRL
ncbi:MAG: hypothetical protein Q4E34_06710, partial [Synergistaceae bacterium]|nr:hypothetical protein [Synergistaceae bacterium]